jgi:hypothetical protein
MPIGALGTDGSWLGNFALLSTDEQQIITQTVTHEVAVAQVISKNTVRNFTIISSAAATQTLLRRNFFEVSVIHDVTAVQTIRPNFIKRLSVISSATVQSVLSNLATFVTHTATVSQVITVNKIITRAVSNSATVSQTPFVQSPRLISVNHTVTVSQDILGRNAVNRQSVVHSALVSQDLFGRNAVNRQTIIDNVIVGQVITIRDRRISITVIHTATVNQRVNTIYNKHVEHDVSVISNVHGLRSVFRGLVDTITLSEDYTSTHAIERIIVDQLTLTEQYTNAATFARVISDGLIILETYDPVLLVALPTLPAPQPPGTPLVLPTPPIIPGVIVASRNRVIMYGSTTAITLPTPEFGDSESGLDTVSIKRGMTGSTYIYKQTSSERHLKYVFKLGTVKALEFKQFYIANTTKEITLINWKGEVWRVRILNNPFELISVGVFKGQREAFNINVELQGTRIHG